MTDQELNWSGGGGVVQQLRNSVQLLLCELQFGIPLDAKQLGHAVGEIVNPRLNALGLVRTHS